MSSSAAASHYAVLVPVKRPAYAKSRLGELGDQLRQRLVVAFAVDTITAALRCPAVEVVLAVTDDHVLAGELRGVGAQVIPDGEADDLNASLFQAAAEANRRWPHLRLAALCADLPALRASELARALRDASAAGGACFVPDAAMSGTTLLAAAAMADFLPQFGERSRDAHVAVGARELELSEVPGLRRDVDTPADLARASTLGLGERTTLTTRGLRL